jgi:hypothetical protein
MRIGFALQPNWADKKQSDRITLPPQHVITPRDEPDRIHPRMSHLDGMLCLLWKK